MESDDDDVFLMEATEVDTPDTRTGANQEPECLQLLDEMETEETRVQYASKLLFLILLN